MIAFLASLQLVAAAGPLSDVQPEDVVASNTTLLDRAERFAIERMLNTNSQVQSLAPWFPKNTESYVSWKLVTATDWTCGFLPGTNWLLYEATGDPAFRSAAEFKQLRISPQRFNNTTHDVGFMFLTSYGNGYRLVGDPQWATYMHDAANTLAARYNATVGAIRSWDWGPWGYPVIVDNLVNLELLFWSANNGGPASHATIAHAHALKTLAEHVRSDGSTWQIVDFNETTGTVFSKENWAGYSNTSTWSRGHAWAVYGFTMTYRETGDTTLRAAAEQTADYFLANAPADLVPYWDYGAPNIPFAERDSSAAAILMAGLFELSTLASSQTKRDTYFDAAEDMLLTLATRKSDGGYLAQSATGLPMSPGILMNGCGGHPLSVSNASVPNESLIYGDYYFVESLLRYKELVRPRARRVQGPPPMPK